MKKQMIALIFSLTFAAACTPTPTSEPIPQASAVLPTIPPRPTASPVPTIAPTATIFPPIQGPDPSYKVAAFYYPWYGNLAINGQWIHWDQSGYQPPQSIGSDYYPQLGAYSSNDPKVVAQHMAWLRQAGIGIIITSWWGRGTHEDQTVPLLLQMAERYGIKVAFHIEPYSGRSATSLVDDIKYIYQQYGSSPAFFRSTASSRYSPGQQPKGMFFVWCIEFAVQDCGQNHVEASYWQSAMDSIHALPEGALLIANTLQSSWIDGGHFDGLYNYVTLHLDQQGGFAWARSLPPDTLYVPSVIPGNSAKRVGYPPETYVARQDGKTYNDQWTAALGTDVEPALVTITSFNEWHEGSFIEPPAIGVSDGHGYTYADFGALPPDGYLTLTHQWIDKFLATSWPAAYRVRIQIKTTSDWTTLNVVSGGSWLRPDRISASDGSTDAGLEAGDRFILTQPLAKANAGKSVEMVYDVLLTGLDPAGNLVLEIDRGNIGATQVAVYNYLGQAPVEVKTISWDGVTTGRNSFKTQIPSAKLLNQMP